MRDDFAEMLLVGGKSNSLGLAGDVVQAVLDHPGRLEELYQCLFHEDAWARMRAADSIEKVCREHPEWLLPYIDRFQRDLAAHPQPSIQWHLAQMYRQVELTPRQKASALDWLAKRISTTDVDWVVSANTMVTLMQFTADGSFPRGEMSRLLQTQQRHKSKAVVRRAGKLLAALVERKEDGQNLAKPLQA